MTTEDPWRVGDRFEGVRVGAVAHGGHWVARHEGRVLFVRHALAGEVVTVEVTGLAKRYAFADAVAVADPSPHRVTAPCPVARACGGCDFQHVEVGHQRELKRQVVAEQLRRLAGLDWDGSVEALVPDSLGWRRRMRYHRSPDGWGLRAKGSHEVVELPEQGCLIASPALARPDAAAGGEDTLVGADALDGPVWLHPGEDVVVRERAAARTWAVRADGFWQVHPQAADVLADAVLGALAPAPGERALDLYCGVGLFSGVLADAGVTVTGVEGSADAVALARGNVPGARFHAGPVDLVLRRLRGRVDLVVLDPPRVGAGRGVLHEVCRRRPRAIAYVACDPAALARDLAVASDAGYQAESVRAFDLFPMTHHVECVALLVPR
ncbi:MAG: class I SAM-dependent RNA methyltransferase [Actinomycetes bacterium]